MAGLSEENKSVPQSSQGPKGSAGNSGAWSNSGHDKEIHEALADAIEAAMNERFDIDFIVNRILSAFKVESK